MAGAGIEDRCHGSPPASCCSPSMEHGLSRLPPVLPVATRTLTPGGRAPVLPSDPAAESRSRTAVFHPEARAKSWKECVQAPCSLGTLTEGEMCCARAAAGQQGLGALGSRRTAPGYQVCKDEPGWTPLFL